MIRRTKIRGNGITFLYEQNQSAGGVSAALFFKCGVNYEKEKEFGVSRFAQELLFRRLLASAGGCRAVFRRMGRDHAAFLCEAAPGNALRMLQALAGLTDLAPFSPEETAAVRADLLRECAARLPTWQEVEGLYFALPSYTVPAGGTERALRSLTGEQLEKWRGLYGSRSNACFVLTGAFGNDELKEAEAFLRELPPQPRKSLNTRPLLPERQFFRTSADDVYLPCKEEAGRISLLVECDLGETQPVWAALLRDVLAAPGETERPYAVHSSLRYYGGFALLRLTVEAPHGGLPAAVEGLADAVADLKENLTEEQVAPLLPRYAENRLYPHPQGAGRAYELGLHNFILYTDDILLPDGCDTDEAMERLLEAADNVLLPDNALFVIHYNEKRGASLPAIKNSVAEARIRLFV